MTIADWVEQELKDLDCGDKRLQNRVKLCVTQAASMGESTPHRSRGAAALKATYRLMDNSKVTMDAILDQHHQASIERCAQHQRVYFVQDTTEVDLTKPKTVVQGAGPLATDRRRGFFYHPLHAFSERGIALGVVDEVLWTRDERSLERSAAERKAERQRACFEEKESCRWLEMMQSGEQIARANPSTHFTMVADSEADISELLCQAEELPENYGFIIRAGKQHNILQAADSATGHPLQAAGIEEALATASWRGRRSVSVGGRDAPVLPDDKKRGRKQAKTARQAELRFRAITITLAGPQRPGGGRLANVRMGVVEALETNPPEGEEPIRWVLLTSLAVDSVEQIEAVLDGYCMRWNVELYFKTLKSGLKIEEMKYETLERYVKAFSLVTIVAWRVEYLKGATRAEPTAPCSKYFEPHEWIAIMAFLRRSKIDPTAPPMMLEFMTSIAELGGYINKKSQGPPGSKTIWRGMMRFDTIVEAFAAFNQMTCGA